MQVIILWGLISAAHASGEFSTKVTAHANAVATTKEQVRRVGDAQLKFKDLMSKCAPKNISTQEVLLSCGQKFLQLNLEFKNLRVQQAEAQRAINGLPPEFSVSTRSLNQTLQESSKILNMVTDTPEHISNSLFSMNSVYVQKQFEREYKDAFVQGRMRNYCANLQSEIDTLARLAQTALNNRLSFATLYKQSQRLRNTQLLAKEISPICKQTYNMTSINAALRGLDAQLTSTNFAAYKKATCKNPNASTGLTTRTCEQLPLTPYSIQWLELARVTK